MLHDIALLVALFVLLLVYNLVKKRKYKLPPGPVGLPIVGYLPFLENDPPRELQKLSNKYGNIFSVYLGRRLVVVVADSAIAKELLSKPAVLDRPEDIFILLPGGVGFPERNGHEWVEQRRYTLAAMKNLGFGRSHWEMLVEMEVCDFLSYLEKSEGKPVDIFEELSIGISNNALSLVTGKRVPKGHPKRKIIDKGIISFETIYGQSGFISHFPKLFQFCVKGGLIKGRQMLKDMENFNNCVRQEIEELRKEEDGEFYVHKYFAEIEKNERLNLGNTFNYRNLLGNTQALIVAGSDPTRVSIMWLLLAMASYPDIQDKVQEELDSVLGKDCKITGWADRQKLPYCLATIYEGQRWRTVVPLSLKHRTTEDMEFKGYDIPKGSNIVTLIFAFHNNPKYWKNPDTFHPERFLSEDGKFISEPESYLPFASGKRRCPGKTLTLIEIFLYFISIIQKFRILPASDTIRPDLKGFPGLTLQPKRQPLRFIPR